MSQPLHQRQPEPSIRDLDTERSALADFLRHHPAPMTRVQLVADEAEEPITITVPLKALELLAEILEHLDGGVDVSIVPVNAELTTQQAADLLGVSRPYLISKVLQPDGPVGFRTVGRHRRIRFADLDTYRREDERRRKMAADTVTKIGIDAGLDD